MRSLPLFLWNRSSFGRRLVTEFFHPPKGIPVNPGDVCSSLNMSGFCAEKPLGSIVADDTASGYPDPSEPNSDLKILWNSFIFLLIH